MLNKKEIYIMDNAYDRSRSKNVSVSHIKKMTACAMCMALTFIATAFINIRLPIQANGGLIHLGNVVLFTAAVLFGRKIGALAGGIGMALFDLMGGWVSWAPFTLIIVGLMGWSVGLITEKKQGFGWLIISYVVALLLKVSGYYIAEGILYGNWIVPAASIAGNVVQVTVGAVIATPLIFSLKKILKNQLADFK